MPRARALDDGAPALRIGTWNLAGRWSDDHRVLLTDLQCDVLLLTEVPEGLDLDRMTGHTTQLPMADRRSWAGVWSRHVLAPLADPHGASAFVETMGLRWCASVLPWRSCGAVEPWIGSDTTERTSNAVTAVARARPDVWGGDWNHAMYGREYAGSRGGRARIRRATAELGLEVVTADAAHPIAGLSSIDHIAVPASWTTRVEHHPAAVSGRRLSDHDAYVAEVVDRPA